MMKNSKLLVSSALVASVFIGSMAKAVGPDELEGVVNLQKSLPVYENFEKYKLENGEQDTQKFELNRGWMDVPYSDPDTELLTKKEWKFRNKMEETWENQEKHNKYLPGTRLYYGKEAFNFAKQVGSFGAKLASPFVGWAFDGLVTGVVTDYLAQKATQAALKASPWYVPGYVVEKTVKGKVYDQVSRVKGFVKGALPFAKVGYEGTKRVGNYLGNKVSGWFTRSTPSNVETK